MYAKERVGKGGERGQRRREWAKGGESGQAIRAGLQLARLQDRIWPGSFFRIREKGRNLIRICLTNFPLVKKFIIDF